MSTTIYQVLDELRASSTSEASKGSKFERLFAAYLKADPVYADQFSDVWLWQDWPGRDAKHDTGIDLVAVDRLTGGHVAIQCKFYDPHSTIGKGDIDSFLSASGKEGFTQRIIVSTTDKWNIHAEDAIQGQQIPVRRIGLAELEASPIDWAKFSLAKPDLLPSKDKRKLLPHQVEAVTAVELGFQTGERGKLIMACGTGKTFTSLRLAERMVGAGGCVLFLVPSISLLSQALREWATDAEVPLAPIAVCSDRKATVRSKAINEDISAVDLALPATTDVAVLKSRLTQALNEARSMTVVFATYQSIDVVAHAQKQAELAPFDLIVCDEAHRTTGTTLLGEDESAFVRVHDNNYLRSARRLYMTATPRIYDDSSKAKAGEANAVLASMDDEHLYGPEFHRLGFGEAVGRDLLADYKVLVLAVDETAIARTFQVQLSQDGELKLDDAAKIIGCWNGLAKRGSTEHSFDNDSLPMQRAVAFAGTIRDSRRVEALFAETVHGYTAANDLDDTDGDPVIACEVQHVDGTYNALERNKRLDWLRADVPDGTCRILTNARCLSEGVDVPALDAVMFLSARKSVVDIVQSVGRVMRKDPTGRKKYGYIILPIGIPHGVAPETALRDNKRYAAVWEVLQALRAHDERFNAMVNRIDLTSGRDNKINVIGVPEPRQPGEERGFAEEQRTLGLTFATLDEWRDAIYAKIVAKVGSRKYWEQWAKDVADIAQRHITRITALLDDDQVLVKAEFNRFLDGLRANLNEGISAADAVEMLAQHLITRPVFDALFGGYDFAAANPVAQTMEQMLTALDEHALDDENESLERFYDSVRMRVDGVNSAEGRQRLIVQLYNTFFRTAFAKTVDKLGIVYTPVEIVDFILRSADEVLRKHFGQGLTDEGVHILDGFTGTGTFMVRLLQLGLVKPEDLARKYANELHANEILLLAYYIAAVNIETTYQDLVRGSLDGEAVYEPFPGLVLTDTFQSWEDDDRPDLHVFAENNNRLERLKKLPITVIVGNPPYSVGQDSANDNNANQKYPALDQAIRDTYAYRSNATLLRNLYDSYVRAIKWASLRIRKRGAIAYVTNGAWLDSNSFDGMRLALAEEFSDIYIYNLRGNQRTAGEQSHREGGKIFDAGSRATVAITLLVKDPACTGPPKIEYTDIGDYLSREQKLAAIAERRSIEGLHSRRVRPNEYGDWINQRRHDFARFLPLKGDSGIFRTSSLGVFTSRDAWVVGSSLRAVQSNIARLTESFNAGLADGQASTEMLNRDISWSRSLRMRFERRNPLPTAPPTISQSVYRPFFKQWSLEQGPLLETSGRTPGMFTTAEQCAICVLRPNDRTPFAALMVSDFPNLGLFMDAPDVYPLFQPSDAKAASDQLALESSIDAHNVTNEALSRFRAAYGDEITKDDIVFYVYGMLHSPDYRESYAADLKKMIPRIPLVADGQAFIEGGRALSGLHLAYERVTPYPLDGLHDHAPIGDAAYDHFRVARMTFAKARDPKTNRLIPDRSRIVYNSRITVGGIPEEAYRYILGPRSAIEWIMDRYQIKKDKASGLVNDPNDWSREVSDPRYIIDLLARIVTVSLETIKLIDALPPLDVQRVDLA